MRFLPILLRGAQFLVPSAVLLVAPVFAQWPVPGDERELLPFPLLVPLTLERVQTLYGEPSERVGADLWIYWDFPFVHGAARRAGYDTLVVHFDGVFARTVKLVRATDVRALLQRLGQAKRMAAAKPRP